MKYWSSEICPFLKLFVVVFPFSVSAEVLNLSLKSVRILNLHVWLSLNIKNYTYSGFEIYSQRIKGSSHVSDEDRSIPKQSNSKA